MKRERSGFKQRLNVDSSVMQRGKYIVKSVAACGSCHAGSPKDPTKLLIGGLPYRDRWGEVHAANITPHAQTGIGLWSVEDIIRALRTGIGRNNTRLSLDAHSGYRWMSDRDIKSVAKYILSQSAVKNRVKRRKLGLFSVKKLGLVDRYNTFSGYTPSLAKTESVNYGRYLALHVSNCSRCHGGAEFNSSENNLAQGEVVLPNGIKRIAPNIRAGVDGRLSKWPINKIVFYLSRPGSKKKECPTIYYSSMSRSDKVSIAKYLKSLSN